MNCLDLLNFLGKMGALHIAIGFQRMVNCGVFLLILHVLPLAYCTGQDQPLPRNYRSVTQEVIIRAELRDVLDVSPQQLERIRQVSMKQEVLDASQKFKLAETRHEVFPEDSKALKSFEIATAELNLAYRDELAKNLLPEQLDELIPASMRLEFRSGISPFENKKCLHYCGVTTQEHAELAPHIDKCRSESQRRYRLAIAAHARAVLSKLSPESKQLFANYAGIKFVPEVKQDPSLTISDIPYSARISTCTTIESALYIEDLQKQIELSAHQFAELTTLKKQRDSDFFRAVQNGAPSGTMDEYFRFLRRGTYTKMRALLTDSQFLQIAQHRASDEFESNFSGPFAQPELIAYLKLPAESVVEIKIVAAREKVALQDELSEMNFQIFEALCIRLSREPQQRMRELFADVWKSKK